MHMAQFELEGGKLLHDYTMASPQQKPQWRRTGTFTDSMQIKDKLNSSTVYRNVLSKRVGVVGVLLDFPLDLIDDYYKNVYLVYVTSIKHCSNLGQMINEVQLNCTANSDQLIDN